MGAPKHFHSMIYPLFVLCPFNHPHRNSSPYILKPKGESLIYSPSPLKSFPSAVCELDSYQKRGGAGQALIKLMTDGISIHQATENFPTSGRKSLLPFEKCSSIPLKFLTKHCDKKL